MSANTHVAGRRKNLNHLQAASLHDLLRKLNGTMVGWTWAEIASAAEKSLAFPVSPSTVQAVVCALKLNMGTHAARPAIAEWLLANTELLKEFTQREIAQRASADLKFHVSESTLVSVAEGFGMPVGPLANRRANASQTQPELPFEPPGDLQEQLDRLRNDIAMVSANLLYLARGLGTTPCDEVVLEMIVDRGMQ